ncbi:serine/threonine-protein kinase [Actinomadura sp. NTSP31]|uniref:serine/threonine-protein kinase n=1 Tax=Actinomadura sp. NTSP31 TaxID=1735447 RepID=UPI0035C0B0DE
MQDEMRSEGLPAGVDPLGAGDPPAVGPYPLLGKLGEGGMGTVYFGRGADGRPVAIKVIKPEMAADERYRARFQDEVRHAQQVASFCTAAVLDYGDDAGRPYLVTEYVDGRPLSEHIKQQGGLPPGTVHGLAVGVAAALTAIHAAGLVHRDLKPANVLLSISGPRVIDFGIARGVGEHSGHTKSGFVVGSPGWISPEQVQTGQVSPASDVFAWGCLVALAGTGRHPFSGSGAHSTSDPLVVAYRAQQRMYDLGDLAEPLRTVVAKALSPEPGMRPTAQQLLLALVGGSAPGTQPDVPAGTALPGAAFPSAALPGAALPGVAVPGTAADPPIDILAAASHTVGANWRPEDLPLWSRPAEPLPPPPPAPPVDRKALRRVRIGVWLRRVAGLVVVAALAAAGLAYYQHEHKPAAAEFGRPAKDGDMSFQASPPKCGGKVKGVTAKEGRLCQVTVTVTNTGTAAEVLAPANQWLLDADGGDRRAIMLFKGRPGPKTRVNVQSLPSAESFTGVLLFDVPSGFVPRAVEFHQNGSSNGVRLTVP